jgi:radical SAM protein with 4Fe4S-binding SPASM domain
MRKHRPRKRLSRAARELMAKVEEEASAVEVEACTACHSRQLCEPDCRLAPWNQEPGPEAPR